MLQIVDKKEVAKRKPYRFSQEVSAKMEKAKKERKMKRIRLSRSIVRVNDFTEIIQPEDNLFN